MTVQSISFNSQDSLTGSVTYDGAAVGSIGFATKGYGGGDAGHGGYVTLIFSTGGGSTDLIVDIDGRITKSPRQVSMTFRGDSEMFQIIAGLKVIVDHLTEKLGN